MRFFKVRRTESGWSIHIDASDPTQLYMPLTDPERTEVRRMIREARDNEQLRPSSPTAQAAPE